MKRTVTELSRIELNEMARLFGMILEQRPEGEDLTVDIVVNIALKVVDGLPNVSKCVKKAGRRAWSLVVSAILFDVRESEKLFETMSKIVVFDDGSATIKLIGPNGERAEKNYPAITPKG